MPKFQPPRREDINAITRRLGALERPGFEIKGTKRFLTTPLTDGRALFLRPTRREIGSIVQRFEELGLTDLIEPPPEYENDKLSGRMREFTWKESNSSARICAAIDARAASIETFVEGDPPPWREFGEREVEAWFLTNFAYFYSRQNASYADIAERLRWAHALGRLLEWRRWRREGHDLGAVQQARFSSGRDKKEGSKAVTQSKDRRRREIAEIVGKLGDAPRFKTGKKAGEVNFSEWAREVLKEARIDSALAHQKENHAKAEILNEIAGQTKKTVIGAIKLAIKNEEIGKTK